MKQRPAFTLMEVLMAAALGGVVLALGLQGFTELNKVFARSRSQQEAQSKAATAAQQLAGLLKRAHVLYHDARPITGVGASPAQASRRDGPAIDALGGAPYRLAANIPSTLRDFNQPSPYVAEHRFTSYLKPLRRLGIHPSHRGGLPVEDAEFPGPLAYWAEAQFREGDVATATNAEALLPLRWTFHVLYVAPMYQLLPSLGREPGLAVAGVERDQAVIAGTRQDRTVAPLQLRLLSVEGVRASRGHADPTAAPTGLPYDRASGRAPSPSSGPPPGLSFLAPPYDYEQATDPSGAPLDHGPNYDPIPIPYSSASQLDAASRLDQAAGAPAFAGRQASGSRVAGTPAHANFGDVGNDPPTEVVFTGEGRDPGARTVDRLVVDHIDPDSVVGTSIRLINGIATEDQALTGETYRRLFPAIGFGAQHRDLTANAWYDWGGAALPHTRSGAGHAPSRAVISVTVRHRSRSDIPFAFATVSTEVELEGVKSFRALRPGLN